MVLLDLLVRLSDEYEFWVLSPEDGPLRSEFQQVCRVTILPPEGVEGPWTRRLRHIGIPIRFKRFLASLEAWKPNAIYANSAASLPYVQQLSPLSLTVLVHVHEMESSLSQFSEPFESALKSATRIVAVSDAVKKCLVTDCGIPEKTIRCINNYSVVPALSSNSRADSFVVGASGAPGWIKGSSLFVQLAAEVRLIDPEAKILFKWLGWSDSTFGKHMRLEVKKLHLEDRLELLPHRTDPIKFFETVSIFAHTSWQDSFPLVVLENMGLGNPVLTFEESGGACEAVAGCTTPIKEFSVHEMAQSVLRYYHDPELLKRHGAMCREKVQSAYCPEIILPQFREELRFLTGH